MFCTLSDRGSVLWHVCDQVTITAVTLCRCVTMAMLLWLLLLLFHRTAVADNLGAPDLRVIRVYDIACFCNFFENFFFYFLRLLFPRRRHRPKRATINISLICDFNAHTWPAPRCPALPSPDGHQLFSIHTTRVDSSRVYKTRGVFRRG